MFATFAHVCRQKEHIEHLMYHKTLMGTLVAA